MKLAIMCSSAKVYQGALGIAERETAPKHLVFNLAGQSITCISRHNQQYAVGTHGDDRLSHEKNLNCAAMKKAGIESLIHAARLNPLRFRKFADDLEDRPEACHL